MNKYFAILTLFLCMSLMAQAGELTGEIKGDVRLFGAKPSKKAPAIVEYHGPCGTKRDASVVRLWKKRVMDVTLWLTPKEGQHLPAEGVVAGVDRSIGQQVEKDIVSWKCEFRPRMTVVPSGATVKIMNEDSIAQWLVIDDGINKKKQLMQQSGGQSINVNIASTHDIYIRSGFYPWMNAWIKPVDDVVAVAETGWDGIFKMKGILPGDYILHLWHPSLGEISQEVTVSPDKATKVEVSYQMPDKPDVPVIKSPMLNELLGGHDDEKEDDPFKQ